jgi:chromosome segregation ATPase
MAGEIALYILSGLSPIALGVIGFFLKDLIVQFKALREDVYKINTSVSNLNKDLGYNAARIDHVEKQIEMIADDIDDIATKLTVLRTEHDYCQKEKA